MAQSAFSSCTAPVRYFNHLQYNLALFHLLTLIVCKLDFAWLIFTSLLRVHLRNRRWGGCVYVLQMFFFIFSCLFLFATKNTRQPFSGTAERIFMKLSPNDSGENGVCIAVPKWGLGARPPINFWEAKNYTLRTWWWRLANDSEKLLHYFTYFTLFSLLAMALCSYGGCVTKAWRSECI